MRVFEVDDHWSQSISYYLKLHYRHMLEGEYSFVQIHGLYSEPQIWRIEEDLPGELYVSISVCPVCGWWSIAKQVSLHSHSQIWDIMFRTEGALRLLDFDDIEIPLEEVRAFLMARYEARFNIHPRKFEQVVASVFSNFEYEAIATTYSCDGGIDVVLRGQNDERIGVQVKRYRHSIKAEQIRSFAGALRIGGFTAGIFVTTSQYQSGAFTTAAQAARTCVPIELVDATAFYQAMGIAQLNRPNSSSDILAMLVSETPPKLFYVGEWHRNSL